MLSSKTISVKSIAGTALILTVVIQGCGGGGGGDGGNGGAGGKIYVVNGIPGQDGQRCSEIDVATGAITPLFLEETFCNPIDGGNHFLTIDSANITTGEVEEVDRQGNIVKHFTVPYPLTSVPWFPAQSPDGQYVIVALANENASWAAGIYDWSGHQIAFYDGATAWDWFSDGSLLIVSYDAIYRSNPPDFQTANLIQSFPNSLVTGAFVSPDQSRISIQMKQDEADPNIWTMNSDGTGLNKVTDLLGGGPYLGSWSPDGSTIFIRYNAGLCPQPYSIPSNASGLTLPSAKADPSPARLISNDACLFSPPIFVN